MLSLVCNHMGNKVDYLSALGYINDELMFTHSINPAHNIQLKIGYRNSHFAREMYKVDIRITISGEVAAYKIPLA